jgi:hypothetical protein
VVDGSGDIIFVTKNIKQQAIKNINRPIPHSQYCPISCEILARITPLKILSKRKFHFTKANWSAFSRNVELKSIPAFHVSTTPLLK